MVFMTMAMPWWAWLLIGVGGVAIIGAIIAIVLKSKKK